MQHTLLPEEVRRNARGNDTLFVHVGCSVLPTELREFCLTSVINAKASGIPAMYTLAPPADGAQWLSIFGRVVVEGDEPQVNTTVRPAIFMRPAIDKNQVRSLRVRCGVGLFMRGCPCAPALVKLHRSLCVTLAVC